MNKPKLLQLSILTTVIIAIGYVAIGHRPAEPQPVKILPVTAKTTVESVTTSIVPPAVEIPLAEAEPAAPVNQTNQAPVKQKKVTATKSGKPARVKPPIQDPDARAALSLVGADPLAEQYWAAAINDPNLPANERKDLIEDLNEDGLSDPKHPGPQDLPLIANRLRLIEELAPSAMDAVNADAFAEAYKDLQNLAAGGTAQ
jgi:hypothetical protein